MIKAIFIDIDGTLLDHKSAELEGIRNFYEKYEFNNLSIGSPFSSLAIAPYCQ